MDINQLLEEKQPPAGGLLNLRKRLRQEGRKRFLGDWVLVWSTCTLVLLGIGIGFIRHEKATAQSLTTPFLAQDLPAQQVQVKNGSAIKLFESDTVVYFQVIQPRNAAMGARAR